MQTAVDHMEAETILQAAASEVATKKSEKLYLTQDFSLNKAPEPGDVVPYDSRRGKWVSLAGDLKAKILITHLSSH